MTGQDEQKRLTPAERKLLERATGEAQIALEQIASNQNANIGAAFYEARRIARASGR